MSHSPINGGPMTIDPQAAQMMLDHMLKPWHESVVDPAKAQDAVLNKLVQDYAKTLYGKQHGAEHIGTLDDFRKAFSLVFGLQCKLV